MVVAKYFQSTEQLMNWSAGSMIGTFPAVEADQVDDYQLESKSKKGRAEFTPKKCDQEPEHLQQLHDTDKGSSRGPWETRMLPGLLMRYSTVFNPGDGDVLRTVLVENQAM